MDLMQGILSRRSVRLYDTSKRVSKEDLSEILNAAMHAPSARNTQPWEFVVVSDESLLEKIMAIHPYCHFLKDAGTAIIACGNLNEEHGPGYWICDTANATLNALLAAHAKGLGACWCGIYPREDRMQAFAKLFNMPSHIKPFALIAVGYPKTASAKAAGRFKPSKISLNSYGEEFKAL